MFDQIQITQRGAERNLSDGKGSKHFRSSRNIQNQHLLEDALSWRLKIFGMRQLKARNPSKFRKEGIDPT